MRLPVIALCVILSAAAVGAQKGQTETKTKVTVKDGKDVTITGCVEPMAGGSGFILTHAADKRGALHSYELISGDADVSKHVGHLVQLSGKATDRGDAKVSIETRTKTKVENGDDQETRSTTEAKGDLTSMPYLGVESVKMIAAACP